MRYYLAASGTSKVGCAGMVSVRRPLDVGNVTIKALALLRLIHRPGKLDGVFSVEIGPSHQPQSNSSTAIAV